MIFKFVWSNYLDDYAVFSNSALQKACETTVNAFFHILGIRTSRSDEKCVSFFDCLGITFLLHKTPGELFIQNTSKRCTELCKTITDILSADSLSFKIPTLKTLLRGTTPFRENRDGNPQVFTGI